MIKAGDRARSGRRGDRPKQRHPARLLVIVPGNEIILTILIFVLTLGANVCGAQPGVMLELEAAQTETVLLGVSG